MIYLLYPYTVVAVIVFAIWLALGTMNGTSLEAEDYLRSFLIGIGWLPVLVYFILVVAAIVFLPTRWMNWLKSTVDRIKQTFLQTMHRN